MATTDSFTITRNDLRKALVSLGMEEKSILMLFNILNKAHRHINAIGFVTTLERMGLDREKSVRVLRRMGMDDVIIVNVFRMVDESKIDAEIGKVYNATVDFS
jgi:Fe2+ transport system protein FeoA